MRRGLLVAVGALLALMLAGCNSGPPDTSRLSDEEFNAINGASCGQLEVMIASNTGQFRDFAQWKHDARC